MLGKFKVVLMESTESTITFLIRPCFVCPISNMNGMTFDSHFDSIYFYFTTVHKQDQERQQHSFSP